MSHITQEPSKEEFALGSFLSAMQESNLNGRAMRAAMLKALEMDGAALAQPEPVSPKLSMFKLLAITTAYEQGVGKGKQGTEFNPYTEGTTEREAWRLGYQEGQGMAAAKGGAL